MSGNSLTGSVVAPGRVEPFTGEDELWLHGVGAGYLDVVRGRLLRGRWIADSDTSGSLPGRRAERRSGPPLFRAARRHRSDDPHRGLRANGGRRRAQHAARRTGTADSARGIHSVPSDRSEERRSGLSYRSRSGHCPAGRVVGHPIGCPQSRRGISGDDRIALRQNRRPAQVQHGRARAVWRRRDRDRRRRHLRADGASGRATHPRNRRPHRPRRRPRENPRDGAAPGHACSSAPALAPASFWPPRSNASCARFCSKPLLTTFASMRRSRSCYSSSVFWPRQAPPDEPRESIRWSRCALSEVELKA